jgi:hypothetical protein
MKTLPQPSMYRQQLAEQRRRLTQRERGSEPRPLSASGGLRLPAAVTAQPGTGAAANHRRRRPQSASSASAPASAPAPLRPWRCNSNVTRDTADPAAAGRHQQLKPPDGTTSGGGGGGTLRKAMHPYPPKWRSNASKAKAPTSGSDKYPSFRDWFARQAKHDDQAGAV